MAKDEDLQPGEREFTTADVRAWRTGDWYFVTLAGEVILRRHSRDEAFTHAWVLFNNYRSPRLPKVRRHFSRVELRGDWPYPPKRWHDVENRLEVSIERKR